jgi:hypothetical protein
MKPIFCSFERVEDGALVWVNITQIRCYRQSSDGLVEIEFNGSHVLIVRGDLIQVERKIADAARSGF